MLHNLSRIVLVRCHRAAFIKTARKRMVAVCMPVLPSSRLVRIYGRVGETSSEGLFVLLMRPWHDEHSHSPDWPIGSDGDGCNAPILSNRGLALLARCPSNGCRRSPVTLEPIGVSHDWR